MYWSLTPAVRLVSHVMWPEQEPKVRVHIDSWAEGQALAELNRKLWGERLEDRRQDREVWGRGMWIECPPRVKITGSPVITQQKTPVDRMTQQVDVSPCLLPPQGWYNEWPRTKDPW